LARINLWTYRLPGLADRPEDVEPNLDYEIEQCGLSLNTHLTMSKEARSKFLKFAARGEATWAANFRDLNAAVRRMATLCTGGRIGLQDVDDEIARLRAVWKVAQPSESSTGLAHKHLGDGLDEYDLFDQLQLEEVLRVCQESKNLSQAGRRLFARSRDNKKTTNDSDRIRKYLARFGIQWSDLHGQQ
jgi:transcriptional regulatory protein RtcR